MADADCGNWGTSIIAITAVLEALVLVVITLRIYTRIWIAHSFWWDDFTMILAVLGTTIGAALCFLEVHYGFGTRESCLHPHELREFQKYTYGEWIQTFFTLMWTKISICLFLIRIPDARKVIIPMYWTVAFLLFSNVILTVMWIMQCQPLHAAWWGNGTCMSKHGKEGIILTQALISIVSDFSFAAFPIFALWRLTIDFKTKVALWALMCLGFITGTCCIVRTAMNGQAIPPDESYGGIVNWIWRTFEVQIGIIAASIPSLRPFYSQCRRRMHGQGTSYADNNVKFLGAEQNQQRWVENANATNLTQLAETHSRMQAARPAAMQQDLMDEGILEGSSGSTYHDSVMNGNVQKETQRQSGGLDEEMQKYGIHEFLRGA